MQWYLMTVIRTRGMVSPASNPVIAFLSALRDRKVLFHFTSKQASFLFIIGQHVISDFT